MLHSPAELAALTALGAADGAGGDLERTIAHLEAHLQALSESLRLRDGPAIEDHAQQLQRALARAVEACTHQAARGGVPPALRERLARAGAQVARQRESLARATWALDRAIDTLMPPPLPRGGGLYAANGRLDSSASHGNGSLSA